MCVVTVEHFYAFLHMCGVHLLAEKSMRGDHGWKPKGNGRGANIL